MKHGIFILYASCLYSSTHCFKQNVVNQNANQNLSLVLSWIRAYIHDERGNCRAQKVQNYAYLSKQHYHGSITETDINLEIVTWPNEISVNISLMSTQQNPEVRLSVRLLVWLLIRQTILTNILHTIFNSQYFQLILIGNLAISTVPHSSSLVSIGDLKYDQTYN